VYWGPQHLSSTTKIGLFPLGKCDQSVNLTPHLHIVELYLNTSTYFHKKPVTASSVYISVFRDLSYKFRPVMAVIRLL
jgi:hypothetical protein